MLDFIFGSGSPDSEPGIRRGLEGLVGKETREKNCPEYVFAHRLEVIQVDFLG